MAVSAPAQVGNSNRPSPPPRWVFRLAACVLIPALALAVLELGLRLGGYGYNPDFFLRRQVGGRRMLVENPDFGRRFFPPQLARVPSALAVPAEKPAGSVRIFVFGESAALGDPRPRYAASRYLEVLLRERFPTRRFEVVNTAMTAINSHVILPIARECARYDGDVWLVYMGNNEMVGPFGAATVFGPQCPPRTLVRLSLALQRTRLGQLLVDTGRRLTARRSGRTSWQGMEMFLENEVPPADRRRQRVYAAFESNLRGLVAAGLNGGARVILSTVAVNLTDCPPFGSLNPTALSAAERAALETLRREAADAAARGDWPTATARYAEALRRAPNAADLQFQLAQARLRQAGPAAARGDFQGACDNDTLPFRADSQINTAIARTAAGGHDGRVVLCDAAAQLAAASPAGLPGQESFYEHVHLNFDGNYRLARCWAEAVARVLAPESAQSAADWASQEECEQRLGLTDWNRLSVVEEVLRRLERPPLSRQANNAQRVAALQHQRDRLRQRMDAAARLAARAVYEEAIRRAPDDPALYENFAEFLEATGDAAAAVAARKKVCDLRPHNFFAHYALGTLLKEQRQLPEARACLERAAALHPRLGETRRELGAVLALQKEWPDARRELELARQLDPEDSRAALFLGDVLARLHEPEAALRQFQAAVSLEPGSVEARYRLAEHLAVQGNIPAAEEAFAEVLRLDPAHVRAHLNRGVALARLGRLTEALREFDETLRLDPANQQAQDLRRKALASQRPPGGL